MDRKDTAILVLVAILIGPLVLTGYTISQQSPIGGGGAGTVPDWVNEQGGGVEQCSYLIYRESSTYYAKNQLPGPNRGKNQFSDTDFGAVIDNTFSQLSSGGKVCVIGPATYTFTVARFQPGDTTTHRIGVRLRDNIHLLIEKGATITQADNLNLNIFFAGNTAGTNNGVVLTGVTIEVYGIIDGNFAGQSYPAGTAFQACPFALYATQSSFPSIRARNYGRYGALVVYNGPFIDVGTVYGESSSDTTNHQASVLDFERMTFATVGRLQGNGIDGRVFHMPDGGNNVIVDQVIGQNSYNYVTLTTASALALRDISIGLVSGNGALAGTNFYGVVVDGVNANGATSNIRIGSIQVQGMGLDGVFLMVSLSSIMRANITIGSIISYNNAGLGGTRGGVNIGASASGIFIKSLVSFGTQNYGLVLGNNVDAVMIEQGDLRGNAVAATNLGTGLTNLNFRNLLGFVTENWGATSVADGGTISHGLTGTPDTVLCTTSITDEFCSVTALAATTFTVTITKHDGTAGTTQTIYWYAMFIP